ncbi:Auxin responsive SAUR protein [Quillaja saponaria]|uniref:Auxin responsive SAUR protein n=1 Tax=Quillaja saponaria TaxID=32244 RepID=A0AAD7VMN3_QUISA|nr:Auxin responsive SAUR protein [Quillaja saponaria]
MAKHDQKRSSNYNGKKKGGIVKLKIVVKKLQKSLLLGKESKSNSNCNYCEKCEKVCDLPNCVVPGDVKEGTLCCDCSCGWRRTQEICGSIELFDTPYIFEAIGASSREIWV